MKSGMILVNKPCNLTSNDVVQIIAKASGTKAGHIGTLDPLAIGLLPILIGNCSKLARFFIEHDKSYIAKCELAKSSDSIDLETQVYENEEDKKNLEKSLNIKQIEDALKKLTGIIKQEVPIYSSVKVNGKKLYEYARSNIEVEIPKREIKVKKLELLNYNKEKLEIEIFCDVSKGTYIRSLLLDIAKELGTTSVMTNLIRTRINNFNIDDQNVIDISPYMILCGNYRKEKNLVYEEQKNIIDKSSENLKSLIEKNLINENDVLKLLYMQEKYSNEFNSKIINFNDNEFNKFLNGIKINKKIQKQDSKFCFIENNGLLSIARIESGNFDHNCNFDHKVNKENKDKRVNLIRYYINEIQK